MTKIVEAAGIGRLALLQPLFARLAALPRPGGEAEHLEVTPQRSRVRARMSALMAATVIGRPRMDPELSTNKVTTVG